MLKANAGTTQMVHAQANAGTTKTVIIEIALDAFNDLKNNGYSLCFAKKVNDVCDVVWQSYQDYLEKNTFSWVPQFQIFGTNTFKASDQVTTDTNVVDISLGEEITLDKNGVLGDPSSGGASTDITLQNNYGLIHPGINQVNYGLNNTKSVTPIYIAKEAITTGLDTLTPVDVVQVWFEQNIVTSTMFSDARSIAVEIDLTNLDSATWEYTGKGWITPSAPPPQA